jgi:hypothetical protein
LEAGQRTAGRFVPIQVKAQSATGYRFFKSWFERAPGLALVHVWFVIGDPRFYVFRDLPDVEDALGDHTRSESWTKRGVWTATTPSSDDVLLMADHQDRWDRITDQLLAASPKGAVV